MGSRDSTRLKRVGSTAERQAHKPYHQRMCRTECYPGCAGPGATYEGMSVEQWVDFIDDLGMEVQIVNGEIGRGTPRFRSTMIAPYAGVDSDRMPLFLERAHERGIIVLSYYPAIYTRPLKPIHPEWMMQLLDDGRPPIENDGWFCFNSPYRDWLAEYLIEWLDNLDLDGFYFDDTNYGSHQDDSPWYASCCCDFCARRFRDETGHEIPRKVDFASAAFRRFVNWRYDRLIEFMHCLARRIKARHPHAILDFNSYITTKTTWRWGHPLASFRLEEVGASCFTETFRSPREVGLVARILRSTGTPFGIFRGTNQQLRGFGAAPCPEGEASLIAGLATMMNGGAPCGGPFGEPSAFQREAIKRLFAEYKRREGFVAGRTLKYLALHYSQINRDFGPAEIAHNTLETDPQQTALRPTSGAYEMLNRSHFALDIALDEHLDADRLGQYSVLFLSDSACLSDAHCEAIRRFVDRGGTLIATHHTSLLDEEGQPRGQFALADVLGVAYRGPAGDAEDHAVVWVPCTPELSGAFGHLICCYGQESAVSALPGTEVLCERSSLQQVGPLETFDVGKDHRTGQPAVTARPYGRGEAIYLAADVGGAYLSSPYPPLRRFVASLVRRKPPPLEVVAPEAIEFTAAMRPSGELMVHLLNNPTPVLPWEVANADFVSTFLACAEVNPIRDVQISVNDFKVKAARLPLQRRDLAVTADPAVITVPRIDLHEVVLLTLGS